MLYMQKRKPAQKRACLRVFWDQPAAFWGASAGVGGTGSSAAKGASVASDISTAMGGVSTEAEGSMSAGW